MFLQAGCQTSMCGWRYALIVTNTISRRESGSKVVGSQFTLRVTQMALLRLLTNSRVMGEDLRTPEQAISVYRELRSDERVQYAGEPADAESIWLSFMITPVANGSVWTDAWLAAFSLAHGSRLVSFDAGMQRWAMLHPEVLRHQATSRASKQKRSDRLPGGAFFSYMT